MSTSTGPAPLPRSSNNPMAATTRLSQLGHALRDLQSSASVREPSAARCQHGRSGKLCPNAVRYRSCGRNAKSKTATDGRDRKAPRLTAAHEEQIPERGGNDGVMGREKTLKTVSLPSPRPWKSLARFPHS